MPRKSAEVSKPRTSKRLRTAMSKLTDPNSVDARKAPQSLMQKKMEIYATLKTALKVTRSVIAIPPSLPLTGCLLLPDFEAYNWTLLAWIPCMIVAVTFFVLTAYKFYETAAADGQSSWKHLCQVGLHPLFVAFFRDGSIYFLVIAASLVISSLLLLSVSSALQGIQNISLIYLLSILSFAGSHLILNLRQAAHKRQLIAHDTWGATMAFTGIEGISIHDEEEGPRFRIGFH
ncbi:hypothetical protein M422DRAFT_248888 [Sphaerobolus stellatus SS14]|nr:hypothetical protein M422DRAFT_248888 [Sphaerobolus stellatus SS14]